MHGVEDKDLKSQLESFNKDLYLKFLKPNSNVYDLGAYRGVLSVEFAKLSYNVIAVEGSPRNIEYLKTNTKDYPNVRIIQRALHEETYELPVITRFNDCIGLEHPPQEVHYISLKDLMTTYELPKPDLIKMDIEGMETVVMRSCQSILIEDRPIWQLSIHDTVPHRVQCKYDNYPAFVPVSEGGYNFDNLFKYNYSAFNMNMHQVDHIGGFDEFMIIPNELL